jgi:glycosyltransferase involved in cell wall biosynthesis
MRIAIVNDHFSCGPGGQHRLQNIAQGFSRLEHQVFYVTSNSISNDIVDSPLNTLSAGPKRFFYPYFDEFFGIYRNLRVLPSDIDLLIIGLPNTMSKSLNAIFGLSKKIPTSFDFGGLWTSFFDKGATYDTQSTQLKFIRPISQFYEDSMTLFSSRFPDMITVPTSGMNNLFERYSRRDAHVVYHPVDTSKAWNPCFGSHGVKENIPEKYRKSRFIAIGVKGDEWFVSVLADLIQNFQDSDLVFLVIGSFPKAEYICEKRGLSARVFFTGNVPYSVLPSYIALTQFAVVLTHPDLASIWYAPHNIAKIADYMAMGKPVVTDSLSAIDYVENGVTGFLVGDKENLIRRIGNLLDNQAFLLKISEAARKTALEKFDCVKVAERYLKLFDKGKFVRH